VTSLSILIKNTRVGRVVAFNFERVGMKLKKKDKGGVRDMIGIKIEIKKK